MKETAYDVSASVPKRRMSDVIDALTNLGVTDFRIAPRKAAEAKPARGEQPIAVRVRNAILDAPEPKNITVAYVTGLYPDVPRPTIYKAFADLVGSKLIKKKARGVYAVTSKVTADG